MSHEGLDDGQELEIVINNKNKKNNYNVVRDIESDDEDEENLFNEYFDAEVDTTPKTIITTKWCMQ